MNNMKHSKLLKIATIINLCLGAFLIICGILEFIGLLPTPADRVYNAVGIKLSTLVFISGMLIFISALFTLLSNDLHNINTLIFIGVSSLAWPIFISIALFFSTTPHLICIRLVPTMMTSLFYVIAIMIVKISNEALRRTHKFNPQSLMQGKKKSNVDIASVFRGNVERKAKSSHSVQSIGDIATKFNSKRGFSIQRLFMHSGKKRSSGKGFSKILYSHSRKRGKFRIHK